MLVACVLGILATVMAMVGKEAWVAAGGNQAGGGRLRVVGKESEVGGEHPYRELSAGAGQDGN